MRLGHIPYNSDRFTYNAADKTFTIESSDLCGDHFQQIWDDACDEGFSMVSSKTGNVVTFYHADTIYNGYGEDRELSYWVYKPIDSDLHRYPLLLGVKVLIFND